MNIKTRTRDVKYITRKIFYESDTTTIRLLLATASLGWAMVLMGNLIFGMSVMDRPAYSVMRALGREYTWASLFLLHFVGVIWRLYDPIQRTLWALAINMFGFAIWTISTVALALSIGFVPPTTALEVTMCCASAWALYRTDINPEVVSP